MYLTDPGISPYCPRQKSRCKDNRHCRDPTSIIAKAALTATRSDIFNATGSFPLCASQIAGVEVAVHAVQEHFQHTVLLVDIINAFNLLKHNTALHYIYFECQPFPLFSSTCTGNPLNYSSMTKSSFPRRGPPKVTSWRCQHCGHPPIAQEAP